MVGRDGELDAERVHKGSTKEMMHKCSTEEMMRPFPLHLHLVSLVGRRLHQWGYFPCPLLSSSVQVLLLS